MFEYLKEFNMKFLFALFILFLGFSANANVLVGLVDIQKVITSIKAGQSVQKI